VLDTELAQPCDQFTKFACGGSKAANVLLRFAGLRQTEQKH
jgi:hypothetical protein